MQGSEISLDSLDSPLTQQSGELYQPIRHCISLLNYFVTKKEEETEEEIFFSLLALVNLKTKAGGKISALVFTALSFATVSFYAVQDVKINKKRTWEGCKGNLI